MEINFEVKKKYSKKFSLKDANYRTFTVSIDGSDTSEFAFDLVEENFLTPLDHVWALYIYNSQKNSKFNYKNKKEIIEPKYTDKIDILKNENIKFLSQDRTSENHPLEQTHELAINKNSNYLVCGFTGMKGPRGDDQELSKGVDYLLRNSKIPFIMIKDKTLRAERKGGIYRWLCIIDNQLSNADSAFNKFLPLIETDKDELVVMSMFNYEGERNHFEDIVKETIKEHNIKNFEYENVIIDKDLTFAKTINKRVNFDQHPFDFVILLNNTAIYQKEMEKNRDLSIILHSKSNICVLNQ